MSKSIFRRIHILVFFILLSSALHAQNHYALEMGPMISEWPKHKDFKLSYNLSLAYRFESRLSNVRFGFDFTRSLIRSGHGWEPVILFSDIGKTAPVQHTRNLKQGSTGILRVFQYVGRTWHRFRLIGEFGAGITYHDNPSLETEFRFDDPPELQPEVTVQHRLLSDKERLSSLVKVSFGPEYQIGEYLHLGVRMYYLASSPFYLADKNFMPIITTIRYNSTSYTLDNSRHFSNLGFNLCVSYQY